MIRRASCRRGRVHFGRRFAPLLRLLRLMWCGVLRNRIRECTYSWLRPIWPLLGRCTEISRTLDFYVCFFGRGRTVGGSAPLRRELRSNLESGGRGYGLWLMSLMIRPEYCCRRVCMDRKRISIFLILQYQRDIIKNYSI
jgi:hypothetical protein